MYGQFNQNLINTTLQNDQKRTEILIGIFWIVCCVIGVISYIVPVRALCKIAKKL